VIQNPSDGYVGNARATVTVADSSQYGEESLEEGPVAPYSGDRVEILYTGVCVFHTYGTKKAKQSVSGLGVWHALRGKDGKGKRGWWVEEAREREPRLMRA